MKLGLMAFLTLTTSLCCVLGGANAQDGGKYLDLKLPDFKGQWARFITPGLANQASFDQTKPRGYGQQAPLTPEYDAIFKAILADLAKGGPGNYPTARCGAAGMPHMMVAFRPLEFVVSPETTYILIGAEDHYRRIFTDGRAWPNDIEPTYAGYSIGKWVDTSGSGRYDLLEVETRGFKGPRAYDASGLPLHFDNQSIFMERIYLDRNDPDTLHDEMTVIDHALTRPWTVDKRYLREPKSAAQWDEFICTENNEHVFVGRESYMVSADGLLMPTRKDQPPPDLRYFNRAPK